MANRIGDGKVYKEGWRSSVRDVLWYLLFVGADGLGIQMELPATIQETLTHPEEPISMRKIKYALDFLTSGDKPPLLRYSANGRDFLIFRTWQKKQNVRYPVKPDCPLPPKDVFNRLHPKQMQLIAKNYALTTEFLRDDYAVAPQLLRAIIEVEVEVEDIPKGICAFCAKPTSGPLQFYHDKAKEILNRCIIINVRACAALCSLREKAVGKEKAHVAFVKYLTSEDPFIAKVGHSLKCFFDENIFNGCLEAVERDITHGSKALNARPHYPDPATLTRDEARKLVKTWLADGQGIPAGAQEVAAKAFKLLNIKNLYEKL